MLKRTTNTAGVIENHGELFKVLQDLNTSLDFELLCSKVPAKLKTASKSKTRTYESRIIPSRALKFPF